MAENETRFTQAAGNKEGEPKPADANKAQQIPDVLDINIPDVQDLGADNGRVISLQEAQVRARIAAEEASARRKIIGGTAVAGGVVGGVGYGLAKTGSLVPAGMFLGKWVVGPYAAWKSLPVVDWFANKLNKWGDKLIKKDVPLVGMLGGAMDWVKMKIAPEKSLAEYIKKDKDERRKIAEKALKSLRDEEKKLFKKQDDAAKKKSRRSVIAKRFGNEAADAIIDEIDGIEKGEAEKTEPVEPAKAA